MDRELLAREALICLLKMDRDDEDLSGYAGDLIRSHGDTLLAAIECPWQPIDSAPEGVMVLAADMHAREARHWAFVGWRHSASAEGCVTTPERAQRPATDWKHLPQAPK